MRECVSVRMRDSENDTKTDAITQKHNNTIKNYELSRI